jgi:hypothetical protein
VTAVLLPSPSSFFLQRSKEGNEVVVVANEAIAEQNVAKSAAITSDEPISEQNGVLS